MPELESSDARRAAEGPWPCVYVTVDVVLLAPGERCARVLAISRANDPYRGQLSLPGGFVDVDEDLEAAAVRELHEETGVELSKAALVQLGAYGKPDRDPRHRTISVAYLAVLDRDLAVNAGDDARTAMWVPLTAERAALAFDHEDILADGLEHPSASSLDWQPRNSRTLPATIWAPEHQTLRADSAGAPHQEAISEPQIEAQTDGGPYSC